MMRWCGLVGIAVAMLAVGGCSKPPTAPKPSTLEVRAQTPETRWTLNLDGWEDGWHTGDSTYAMGNRTCVGVKNLSARTWFERG